MYIHFTDARNPCLILSVYINAHIESLTSDAYKHLHRMFNRVTCLFTLHHVQQTPTLIDCANVLNAHIRSTVFSLIIVIESRLNHEQQLL